MVQEKRKPVTNSGVHEARKALGHRRIKPEICSDGEGNMKGVRG